jgi:hypothetical protein
MLDGRHSPRLCELPPRVSRAPPRNVRPLLSPCNPSTSGPRRWADLGGWVVGVAVLAAVLSCAAPLNASSNGRTPAFRSGDAGSTPAAFTTLRDLDLLESRLLAGRERVAWWTAWKREPATLGGRRR